jgi:hypothetical protein
MTDLDPPPPEWDERSFLSLFDLYRIKTRISTLATAIERHGIQGWDRYGRFKTFKAEQPEAQAALDALATQLAWDWNLDNCQSSDQSPLAGC